MPVKILAGEGKEQFACADVAAIGGYAGKTGIIPDQFALHGLRGLVQIHHHFHVVLLAGSQCRLRFLAVRKGPTHPGNFLIGLVPLAGQQNDFVPGRRDDRPTDRLGTVDDDFGPRRTDADLVDDCLWRFAARVVTGQHHAVGEARGDFAHQRAFAAVAVAAAAKDHRQRRATRLCHAAQRAQRVFQRVRRMRVIDDQQRFILAADLFQPSRWRHEFGETFGNGFRLHPRVDQHGGHGEQIGNVVTAEQPGFDRGPSIRRAQPETQAMRRFLDVFGTQHALPLVSFGALRVAQHFLRATAIRQLTAKGIVEIDHRQTQTRPGKQPFLGRRVSRFAAVVIEVVTGQVGEHRDVNPHAVEPPFGDADRAGFQRAGLRPGVGKVAQLTAQCRRRRCRQSGVVKLAGEARPQRTDDRAGLWMGA